MKEEDIIEYCNLMEEIKKRTKVIDIFLSVSFHALYKATTIESICLQLRKILELIALGSLVANKEVFSKVYREFAKCWNAEYIFKDIERINPEFYPKPIIEIPSPQLEVKMDWKDKDPKEYLTKKNLSKCTKNVVRLCIPVTLMARISIMATTIKIFLYGVPKL